MLSVRIFRSCVVVIIIYNKFYFFIRISGEYVFVNQCFQDFFIGFVIVVHLVTIKKFDICLLAGWSSTLFILLVNIFDHTFNLFINNIVRKPKVCFISIKKADKTNIFVVLNKTDYHSKLQNILDDHTKFKKLNKNPTN